MHANRQMKFAILIFSLFSISIPAFNQTNEITIRYIGNCGLHFTDGETHMYADFPYKSGAHHYAEYEDSELENLKENAFYIFTHKHSDHYYKGKMNKILKAKNGKKYGKWNIQALENLAAVIPAFHIEVYKTKHLFSFVHYSYLITWHGKKIFLSGDTEHSETIAGIEGLEWAFIPAWIARDIWESDLKIDSKMIGIYHIGPRDKINIVGEKYLMLDKQGEIIIVPY